MLNLGLESFVGRSTGRIMNMGEFMVATEGVVAMADKATAVGVAFENLCTVRSTIQKYGYTKSVEALVGRQQAMMASTEGIKEWWKKFVAWIKELWAKFKAWLLSFFSNNQSMANKLQERINEIRKANRVKPITMEIPDLMILRNFSIKLTKQLPNTLTRAEEILRDATPSSMAAKYGKYSEKNGVGSYKDRSETVDELNKRQRDTMEATSGIDELAGLVGVLNAQLGRFTTDKKAKPVKDPSVAVQILQAAYDMNANIQDIKNSIKRYQDMADRAVKALDPDAAAAEASRSWTHENDGELGSKRKQNLSSDDRKLAKSLANEAKYGTEILRDIQKAIRASVAGVSSFIGKLGRTAISFGSMCLSAIRL